ncbi:MAG: 3-hydroxybutyryl-CoA dehydrogenase; 3-hydroxyacyl-CoA dehydrogenase [uncultured Gemmatimonadaceae bacterium]|uniref:3-hydroxybutyryl-CoA dehydrogenase 3-hydroxyacyl-CoA dehydrogenase n=1 Tax=uncultured Gemmatimonadaceae bacterium TaxID=246130 RepID=A0A6J4MG71_9BACT|nr:MAG: 3-hydroxybutyryl-CoA dehydrogenase; 3-hydroxyacyl-CoA dehydrogenase [uncultured Gemmatimonadaceae bacterium]
MAELKSIGVLGGGMMGSGIAQVAAQAGVPTVVRELSDAVCARSRTAIERSLAKGMERGKVTPAQRAATLAGLTFTTDLAALAQCDLIVEAVAEELELKNALWRELDGLCPPHTVFASNTSSLTIAAMAAATARADRFVGLHFFNPVPVMRLVEVVRTITTSARTVATAYDFVRRVGKEPVLAKDTSGFVVNRLLIPYLLDAINALEQGVASVQDIDRGMQLGTGHPMGPFALLDFVGLDTIYKIAEIMFDEYRERRFAPPPLLKRMVVSGMYGRKSGKGFYDYSQDPPSPSELGL